MSKWRWVAFMNVIPLVKLHRMHESLKLLPSCCRDGAVPWTHHRTAGLRTIACRQCSQLATKSLGAPCALQ